MNHLTAQLGTKAFIFDYGGTLDTGGQHWGKAFWHAYERAHVPVDEAQFRYAYVETERTLGRQHIVESTYTFRQTLDVKLRLQMEQLNCLAWHDRVLDDVYTRTRQETARSRAILQQLKGHFKMVVVSNFYGNLATVLSEMGLNSLFDAVIESAVVGVRKPDARIFQLGVEALHLPAGDITVVGDSIDKDILPAKEAGCTTIWLQGEPWDNAPAANNAADITIADLEELL